MVITKTNCINCGAPLRSDGYCEYCHSKIRYANEIELNNALTFGQNIEILLKINNNNETILLPLRGSMSLKMEMIGYNSRPEVELVFSGYMEGINERFI